MMENQLKEIKLDQIEVSKTNPRKTFDESALKELSLSIKEVGVLQPILVRPGKKKGKKAAEENYELVCGERRYRASIMAELSSIPANVRDIDDDLAFEMQIVENLERKDVHPIEESEAFNKLLLSGKYSIADIAAKFGKPESFIAQRLKFVDLIDELKKDFYEEKFGIGHAVLLARLDPETQMEQYKMASGEIGWSHGYGTVEELKDTIEDELHDLEGAPFDIQDESFKHAPACSVCPKRSGANPSLFADVQSGDICHDRICYSQKVKSFLEIRVAQIINEGEDIHLGLGWNDKAPDFIKEICDQHNVPILSDRDYNKEWRDDAKESAPKMMYVSGDEAGKIIPIRLTKSSILKGATQSEVSISDQILKIEQRAERALELDNVKIFKAIKEEPKLYDEYWMTDEPPLTELETKAMWYVFYKEAVGWEKMRKYAEIVGMPDHYRGLHAFEFWRDTPIEDLKLNQLARMAIIDQLTTMQEPNYGSCSDSKFYFEIIKEQMPTAVEAIEKEFKAKADKRIKRSGERIEKLKEELKAEKKSKSKSKK